MKYDKLTITGIPKSFSIDYAVDILEPDDAVISPEDIRYDFYPVSGFSDKFEDGIVIFKYNESATGFYVFKLADEQTLELMLPEWAVETDVLLFAAFVNLFLKQHKRARLYRGKSEMSELSDKDILGMIRKRKRFLRDLLDKEGFTMEGIRTNFSLKTGHLRPAVSPYMQVLELQKTFVEIQWDSDDEEDE